MEQDVHGSPLKFVIDGTHQREASIQDAGESGAKSKIATFEDRECWWDRIGLSGLCDMKHTKSFKNNRELCLDVSLFVMVCILTFGAHSSAGFYYTAAMEELFLDTQFQGAAGSFRRLRSMQDFWKFTEGPLMNGLYRRKGSESADNITLGNVNSKWKYEDIFYKNILLGVPRMRQLRVRNRTCKAPLFLRDNVSICYGPYNKYAEDTEPFGKQNGTAWMYHAEEKLHGFPHRSALGFAYSGAGYVQDLKLTKEESLAIIDDLKRNAWLNRGSRAVFVDFAFYNANVRFICIVRLVAEFPATGGAFSSWQFRTIKLDRCLSVFHYFMMASEFFYLALIFNYAFIMIREVKRYKLKYFESFWNSLTFSFIQLSLVALLLRIYCSVKLNTLLEKVSKNPFSYSDFAYLGSCQLHYESIVAAVVIFIWIKVYKHRNSHALMLFKSTLTGLLKNAMAVAILSIFFFSFCAQIGHLILGKKLKSFGTVNDSMSSVMGIILGNFDYEDLTSAFHDPLDTFDICVAIMYGLVYITLFIGALGLLYASVEIEERAESSPNYASNREGEDRFDLPVHDLLCEKIRRVFTLYELYGSLYLSASELRRLQLALGRKILDLEEIQENLTAQSRPTHLHQSAGSQISSARKLATESVDEDDAEWEDVHDDTNSVFEDEGVDFEDDTSDAESDEDDYNLRQNNLFWKVAMLTDLV